ncbi:hypothetical protein FPE01S_03_03510 [Flavihumibacter petaseus NBRC 106054]|uniref:DUF1573 domain-containing protein n=2 Tax=Flavihumibacter TaxID=1004301 RepID=A0A0E9N3D6_9BACT|nr:hypothetical protein FPE01S_03_03510 [Flavihumibacter petaseus NBRC 106054]
MACQNGPDTKANTLPNSPKADAGMAVTDTQDSSKFTRIEWLDKDLNLGQITEGTDQPVAFRFRNTGDKPLIIASVRPGCGCTVAEPPKEPIMPGKEGVIKGTFQSGGRVGVNNKSIVVNANTFGGTSHELHFKVVVVEP